jgi:hypothetical protein
LRAKACVGALGALLTSVRGRERTAEQKKFDASVDDIKGRLNSYYLAKSAQLGLRARADDATRQPFRSPKTNVSTPSSDEIVACYKAGRNALVMMRAPFPGK